MAPTDEELLELMPQGFRDDLALVSRMAAHGAGPEVQPGLFRVTLNTGALDYARAVWDRARALLAQPEPEVVGSSDEELDELFTEIDQSGEPLGWRAFARAVLARWGRPAPAPAGEVGEVVAELRMMASQAAEACQFTDAENLSSAADQLEQRHPAPVPVASDTRYEFSVYDEDYTEQVGGSAPTYVQALSEGQRYFAQYQQDGPHTLEVRRIEVLPPGAFPAPDDAPVPVLPEDAQVIEPAERTILVPVPVPVALSERPWEREGWCDSEGRCWIHCPGQSWDTWVLTVPQNAIDGAHCLPATALPLPSGEVG